ncbi:S-adenosyl-L-methionine-dependent methyltransferase [Glonium stellatum]|uniref:DNA (cytosine-5-)-methyltransferase n=1 Tax=Glonium stellatum TaxID=574774 RepID=A0A8E2FDX6_9PEZI|nr:S-adenosyl-L-methionine-dependent methyltransferase [Glonium stellatum]
MIMPGVYDKKEPSLPYVTNGSSPSMDVRSTSPADGRRFYQTKNGICSLHYVKPSDLTFPKSQYDGWKPPLPPYAENLAIDDLEASRTQNHGLRVCQNSANQGEEHVTFRLENFKVYRPYTNQNDDFELEPLNVLNTKAGANELLFDGVLVSGDTQRYVERAHFRILSIEGYGDCGLHTVSRNIYIQSSAGGPCEIWYRLGAPAEEYQRYHDHFLWLADFAKHFVDYLIDHSDVILEDFRIRFYAWIMDRHTNDPAFLRWFTKYGRTDFRVAVSANVEFLYNESFNLNDDFYNEPIWDECAPWRFSAIKEQQMLTEKTIATPHVYECFKRMYFGGKLEMRLPVPEVTLQQQERQASLGFLQDGNFLAEPSMGDVVGVERDKRTKWNQSADIWLAYIQRTHRNRQGELLLDVIWLYRPADTTISTMTYPIQNELFLSDHCNCKYGEPAIKASEIVCQPTVEWFPKSLNTETYFIRQKYGTESNAFTSLKESDKTCSCSMLHESSFNKVVEKYKPGDCVYIFENTGKGTSRKSILEPVVIVGFVPKIQAVTVRGLLRRARDCADLDASSAYYSRRGARPNELVWTNQTFNVRADLIERRCYVRFFTADDVRAEKIPAPYNRDGAVDCFYICCKLITTHGKNRIRALEVPFPLIHEGFDPYDSKRLPMSALSMFSGGGNFDRALEECGAVKFCTAVDISQAAAHTWLANSCKSVAPAQIYLGSVDDYSKNILDGCVMENIPRIGQIDFISAGSPCPGFSPLQKDKRSDQSLGNASHVTSFASFIDLYRPKYAILENVAHMAYKMEGLDEEKVCSQLIGCLVAMGYQVQQFLIDGWSYGSSQKRSRLFVSVAAPGLVPLEPPPITHSHPPRTPNRSLGKLPNGECFGKRQFNVTTPFNFISAEESTKDLPMIGDSRVQGCIQFPDHRNLRVLKSFERYLISLIPVRPTKQTFMDACRNNIMPEPFIEARSKWGKHQSCAKSTVWGRIDPLNLFATITTKCSPQDAFGGRVLHWKEHRVMTIQEARRAQGIPDNEVILGTLNEKWKIIGNGVDRHAALALGMSLRQAWLFNQADTPCNPLRVDMMSHTAFENDSSDWMLINGIRKITGVASRLMKERALTKKLENGMHIAESVTIKKDKVSRKTQMFEETLDTLSIVSETIIETMRRLPIDPKNASKLDHVLISMPAPITPSSHQRGRKNGEMGRASSLSRKHTRSTSPQLDQTVERKKTRHTGHIANFMPLDWSKVPERTIRRKELLIP